MGYEWNIDITLVSCRLVVVSIGIIQHSHEERAEPTLENRPNPLKVD